MLAPAIFNINDLFKSVLTQISPTSAVNANMAVCELTTNVSEIAIAGIIVGSSLPSLPIKGTCPDATPVFLLAAVPKLGLSVNEL